VVSLHIPFILLQGRDGEQRVIVHHVHVNEGGKAIVGTVNHPGGSEK
jgi:hypothetical protein